MRCWRCLFALRFSQCYLCIFVLVVAVVVVVVVVVVVLFSSCILHQFYLK